MMNLQKAGGVAALVMAATYLVGIVLWVTVLMPAGYGDLAIDPTQHLVFLEANLAFMYTFYLVVYLLNALALIVLVVALYERLKSGALVFTRSMAALGIIWATLIIASAMVANVGASIVVQLYSQDTAHAVTAWLAMYLVLISLGGGNEIVGGLWVLLISGVALRLNGLPKALNYLGILVGLAGVLTTFPPLSALGAVFGLGFIGWFAWAGVVLLRNSQPAPAITP